MKSENSSFVLQQAIIEAACTQSFESGTAKLLPRELRSASQHQATIALDCVHEHLCFISVYFVHLLVRHPRVTISSLYAILG